jgi:outer membrane immunogenic protein
MKRAIRKLISGIAIAGFAQTALAADVGYDPEFFNPGPATYFNWSGFYFGVSGGGGIANTDFGNGALNLLSSTLTIFQTANGIQLPSGAQLALSPDSASFTSFGGFAGYNTQWESVILGLEANYHRTSLDASASTSAPTFTIAGSGPVALYNVDASASSLISLTDYATIRGRAGWALGSFLPYATLGMALGRADITDSARVHFVAVDAFGNAMNSVDVTTAQNHKDQFAFGFAVGGGIDWMVFSGLFLRAEYEFVEFADFGNRTRTFNLSLPSGIQFVQRDLSLHTIRLGLGYKF